MQFSLPGFTQFMSLFFITYKEDEINFLTSHGSTSCVRIKVD